MSISGRFRRRSRVGSGFTVDIHTDSTATFRTFYHCEYTNGMQIRCSEIEDLFRILFSIIENPLLFACEVANKTKIFYNCTFVRSSAKLSMDLPPTASFLRLLGLEVANTGLFVNYLIQFIKLKPLLRLHLLMFFTNLHNQRVLIFVIVFSSTEHYSWQSLLFLNTGVEILEDRCLTDWRMPSA